MPAERLDPSATIFEKRSRLATLVVFAGAALLFFSALDAPLQEPDEARYAEVPRQMLAAGSWLVPVLDGEPYLDKPPLIYWCVMTNYRLFGVHEWSARLVSSTAAFLAVILTWFWARRVFGPGAAAAAALVLTLTARFFYLAHMLTPDSLLCLFVSLSWAALHLAHIESPHRWKWWLVSAVGAGLGVLTKGPVAIVLVAVPTLLWHILQTGSARLSLRPVLMWAAVVLVVAAPWYVMVSLSEPAFAEHFFWKHNVLRYLAPFDHAEPVWFYWPSLLIGTLPWCLLLPRALRPGLYKQVSFCLIASAWCVLFFSCSGSKRAVYILPAFPPLAVALGWYLSRWSPLRSRAIAFSCGVSLLYLFLLAGAWFGLPRYAGRFSLRDQIRECAHGGDGVDEVVCFPRRWDSVSFYLRRGNVRSYSREQMAELHSDLLSRPATLVFVKPGDSYEQFLRELPPTLCFYPKNEDGLAVTGWVKPRQFSLKSNVGAVSLPSGSRTNLSLHSAHKS
jgi:4-amino-4-deoxy-L-arabinose transferase-like glycosyltransferase